MLQIIANALINGLMIGLVAIGFNVIFSTTRIFHLAHAALYVSAVYVYWSVAKALGDIGALGMSISVVLSLLIVSVLALGIEKLVYRPLIERASNPIVSLISSMGLYLLLINTIAMVYGNEVKIINHSLADTYNIIGLTFTSIQITQLIVSIIILTIALNFLYRSDVGLTMRAVADNSVIASVMGVPVQKVRISSMIIGTLLAGLAALLRAWDVGIDPYSGMSITLTAAVAVILGGARSFYGTLVAAVAIAIIQNLTEYWLSAQWKDGVTFCLLLLVLLWKTEGIISYHLRLEEQ